MDRTGIDPGAVEDVDVRLRRHRRRRRPATSPAPAGWPPACPSTCPARPIDRQCGSAQQAVHFAAQAVMAGVNDVVVAGGVQQMSMIPISSAMTLAEPTSASRDPFTGSEGWVKRYGDREVSQFNGAEMIAEKWDISRDDMEAFAVESHERAIRATRRGPLRGRDRPGQRARPRRGPPRAELGEDPLAADARRGRPRHRRRGVADLRRLGRAAHRERGRR